MRDAWPAGDTIHVSLNHEKEGEEDKEEERYGVVR